MGKSGPTKRDPEAVKRYNEAYDGFELQGYPLRQARRLAEWHAGDIWGTPLKRDWGMGPLAPVEIPPPPGHQMSVQAQRNTSEEDWTKDIGYLRMLLKGMGVL